eukprot:94344_1
MSLQELSLKINDVTSLLRLMNQKKDMLIDMKEAVELWLLEHGYFDSETQQILSKKYEINIVPSSPTSVLEISKGAIGTGYYKERKRMKNKDNECSHHQFDSIQLFFMYIQKLALSKKSTHSDILYFQFDEGFVKLIGNGCCKQCVLYIVSNIEYFIKSDAFAVAGIRDRIFGDIENIAWYLVNCMQYQQTANFILNQSNIWKQMIDIHGISLNQLQNDTFKTMRDVNCDIIINDEYVTVTLMVYQLLRNIKLLTNYHWSYIILNGTYFNDLLLLIEQQLRTGLYDLYPYGQQSMYAMFAFTCYIFYHMKQIVKDHSKINKWIQSLKSIMQEDTDLLEKIRYELINSFISLQDEKYVTDIVYYFQDVVKEVHKLKWMDIQCQYGKCKKRRSDRKKFYKCISC